MADTPVPPKSAVTTTGLAWIAVIIFAGIFGLKAWDQFVATPVGPPAPVVAVAPEGVKAGTAYRPLQDAAYADACDAFASAIEAGKTVADAQPILQETFLKQRQTGFTASVAPSFAKVLAEGAEPTTYAQRAAVAAYWRGVGKAFRGVAK